MKKTINLTVNGRALTALVEPRMQLADFVRDELSLTGTHVGCEHGVCGACTLQIDGAPARSCITYAVTCNGADVRTIEGFEDDAVMSQLREAFSAEHALQCGYCTPGMLVTARDIVLRLPHADEARVRKELAGNLCRCTGYVGIVRAIQRVLGARAGVPAAALRAREITELKTVPTRAADSEVQTAAQRQAPAPHMRIPGSTGQTPTQAASTSASRGTTTLQQTFTVDHSRDKVWDFFGHLDEVTLCLPGTSIVGAPTADRVETTIRIKLGPIVAEFVGIAEAMREAPSYTGLIRGSARDSRTGSATRGEIRYALAGEKSGSATRVDVHVTYTLTGPLAQFSRSGIVEDIARRMTAAFAQNLESRLGEGATESVAPAASPRRSEIDAGSLVYKALLGRVAAFLRKLLRR